MPAINHRKIGEKAGNGNFICEKIVMYFWGDG
jgi:hypothetical protein